MLSSTDIDRLHGAAVRTVDGHAAGRVCGVITDDDGEPMLLGVCAGVLDLDEVLVPAGGAVLTGREVLVLASRAAFADAPRFPGAGDLSADDLAALEQHWGERSLYGGDGALQVEPAALQTA